LFLAAGIVLLHSSHAVAGKAVSRVEYRIQHVINLATLGYHHVRFSRDSRRFVTITEGSHDFWVRDIATAKVVAHWHNQELELSRELHFLGHYRIASLSSPTDGASNTIIIWNWSLNSIEWRIVLPGISIHYFAVSPDGTYLAATCSDGSLRIWSISNRKLVRIINVQPRGNLIDVDFSPDGTMVATTDMKSAKLWKWRRSEKVLAISGVWNRIQFDTTGRYLVFGANRRDQIAVWDIKCRREITRFALPGMGPVNFAIVPNGFIVAVVGALSSRTPNLSNPGIRFVDIRNGKFHAELQRDGSLFLDVEFSPDGQWFGAASIGGRVQVWRLIDPTRLKRGKAGCAGRNK